MPSYTDRKSQDISAVRDRGVSRMEGMVFSHCRCQIALVGLDWEGHAVRCGKYPVRGS